MPGTIEITASAFTAREFRDCVGEFVTGVTVVTSGRGRDAAGMTLNSFASVSLDPFLVLVSLANGSRTLEAVRRTERFAISLLRSHQSRVALAFATRGAEFPAAFVSERNGEPVVTGSLAALQCRLAEVIPAGDHSLALGEVLALEHDGGKPLIFHRGRLGSLAGEIKGARCSSIGGWESD